MLIFRVLYNEWYLTSTSIYQGGAHWLWCLGHFTEKDVCQGRTQRCGRYRKPCFTQILLSRYIMICTIAMHQLFCGVHYCLCWYSVRFSNVALMYCTYIFSFTRIHQQVYPAVWDNCGQARTYVGRTDWFWQNQGRSTNPQNKNFLVSKISTWSCDKTDVVSFSAMRS